MNSNTGMTKYLFFASGVVPDSTATTEELCVVKLSDLSQIVNGAADEFYMVFKNTAPQSSTNSTTQLDDLTITIGCANSKMRGTILRIMDQLARFEKDPDAHILTVFDGTAPFVTKLDSALLGCSINMEEAS